MMIKYFDGTVFNVDTDAIVNTVNCDGFMGAGLALEFALRYPKMYEQYKKDCATKSTRTGLVNYYNEENIVIINFPTKNSFKFPSHIKWIELGLINFVQTYKSKGITSVAFPKLGTANGGLSWNDVKELMEKYLSNLDIDIYICLDIEKEAQGIEKVMLNNFNKMSTSELASIIRLSQKQIDELNLRKPYSRFWQIQKTPTIGITTYKKMFEYFYSNLNSQMKLF